MSKEFRAFLKTCPEVGKAYTGLFKAVMDQPALDAKTKQLILIAVMSSRNYPQGVRAHVPLALAAGATREELIEAVVTPLPVSGVDGVIECLQPVLELTGEGHEKQGIIV